MGSFVYTDQKAGREIREEGRERKWTRLKYPLGLVPMLFESEVLCVSVDRARVFTWAAPRQSISGGHALQPLSGHCPNTGVVCGRREKG